jgi:hypothetical protein
MNWAICLPLDAWTTLAPLRLITGLQVAVQPQTQRLWLRGPGGDDEHLWRLLRGLPALERYEILGDHRLRRLESLIPSATLPDLEWEALSDWLQVELRPRAVAGKALGGSVPLRLTRTGQELVAELLMTRLDLWESFANNAPEVRLRPLRFAVDADRNVLIRGNPLPPLPGRHFVVLKNLAVPAGFRWEPAVSPEVVAVHLGLPPEALALFFEDGTFSRLEDEQFVAATRSAVRATAHDLIST